METTSIGAERTPTIGYAIKTSATLSKHRLRYHLVFIPKYRKRVLEGKVAARLEQLLRQACEVNQWNLEEFWKS